MELILRSSRALQNTVFQKKKKIHTQSRSSLRFLPALDSWVLSPRLGEQQQQKLNILYAYLQPYVDCIFSVILSNKPQALKLVKVLLLCSIGLFWGSQPFAWDSPSVWFKLGREKKAMRIFIWRQKDFHALLPKHRASSGEAAMGISKSKTKGHSVSFFFPEKLFFFWKKGNESPVPLFPC